MSDCWCPQCGNEHDLTMTWANCTTETCRVTKFEVRDGQSECPACGMRHE